jgi:hypothetical protein
LVDGSDALALEGFALAFMVVCLRFFLELVSFFYIVLSFIAQIKVNLLELGGKYKGIHPHHSIHHFMLICYWFNKGLLREV